MCGIAGSIGTVDEGQLRLMTQMLYHRGPDDGAVWISPSGAAGLGHRRLAVIDTSAEAVQPMLSDDGRYALVFNGELFNFRELRSILENRGVRFHTQSDSEVLLQACIAWGEGVVHKLVGQFAFAFWDDHARTLFAARDHLGIKPFVYAVSGERMLFASEAKSLLAADPSFRRADWSLLPQYLAFLWVPGERSMFAGVRRLLPGHWLRWKEGRVETGSWWDVTARWRHAVRHQGGEEARRNDFLALFGTAVQSQLMSDVPLGLLLSGGIDSSAILAAMSEGGAAPQAFTAAYRREHRRADVFEDDLVFARQAAGHFHASLEEETLDADVSALLPEAVYHCDDPLADPTIVTNLALTRAAKRSLTVLLSGMGADEILAGYPRYPAAMMGMHAPFSMPSAWRALETTAAAGQRWGLFPARYTRRVRTLSEGLQYPFPQSFLRLSTYLTPERQNELLHPGMERRLHSGELYAFHNSLLERTADLTPLQRMLAVDLQTFLPCLNLENMDKTSMANAVEIRVPFLDHRLVEFSMTLPDGDKLKGRTSKRILRKAMGGILPDGIIQRRKTGYSPPVRGWVAGDLSELIRDVLFSAKALQRDLFSPSAVNTLIEDNRSGIRDNSLQIWQLLVLELWQRIFLDESLPSPVREPAELRTVEPLGTGA